MPKVMLEVGAHTYQVEIKKDHTYAYDFIVTVPAMSKENPVMVNRQAIINVTIHWRLFNSSPLDKRGEQVLRDDGEKVSLATLEMFQNASLHACKLAMLECPDWETQAKLEFIDEQIAILYKGIFAAHDKIESLGKEREEILTAEIQSQVDKLTVEG